LPDKFEDFSFLLLFFGTMNAQTSMTLLPSYLHLKKAELLFCSCLQIAKAFGASQVIVVDVLDEKLQNATMLGATHCKCIKR
jgi:D-arabinose 1-dehydrogenase-like Zn-dependent alcohol dehydrogenase